MREWEFIEWIRRQGKFDPSVVVVGPGDDCAVVRAGGQKLLVTADQVLDGVHFSLAEHGPEAAGRKAAARNLSDIAAMAGLPLAMVATVAAPKGFSREDAESVYRGLRAAGDAFDCPLVGGDVAAWSAEQDRLQVSVTMLGRSAGIEPVLRVGAKVGDAVCVTGALGGAWSGRRHLTFTPRVHEARKLACLFAPTAMIDVSDGLAADLAHIAAESAVGAEVDASAVPVHPDARGKEDPLAAALYDGEDYELLFTLPAANAEQLIATQPLGIPVARIGVIVEGSGLTLLREGRRQPLPPGGWEHRT
jgi:thiamine-monophosphate kinase